MKTVLVFGGLNGLAQPKTFRRVLQLEHVATALERADRALEGTSGAQQPLASWLCEEAHELYQRSVLHRTSTAIVALQWGIAHAVVDRIGPPAWVSSISLGDVVRSAFAGCGSLDAALTIAAHTVEQLRGTTIRGATVFVIVPRGRPMPAGELDRLAQCGVSISPVSERMFNMAGADAAMAAVALSAAKHGWRCTPMADFPTHSPLIKRQADALEPAIRAAVRAAPRLALYSTQLGRQLSTVDELRAEHSAALTRPYNWRDALKRLVHEHGIQRVVNVGPCATLRVASKHSKLPIEIVDATALL